MRILLRVLGVLVALAVILGAGFGVLHHVATGKFNPDPPSFDYPKPRDAREAQNQDLDYFRKLVALDRAYAPQARAEAEREIDALLKGPVLDRGHMRVALMRIAALADNGHTSLHSKEPTRSVILPIRLSAFSDGLYVMRTAKENADLLGAQLVAVDGRPLEEVLTRLESIRGGIKPWRRDYAQWVLNSSEILYGLGLALAPDRSVWTFRTRTGGTVTRALLGKQPPYDDPAPDLWRWMSPEPVKDDSSRWAVFVPDGGWKTPLAYVEPDALFRRARIGCVMLIQLKTNKADGLPEFLKSTEDDLKANKPCAVIFDNRFNGGGDYTYTAGFADRLPALVDGRIYILTGIETFSAGITTTVFIKQASKPGQTMLLGQPVGDRLTFWSEGGTGCLPHAPFCFHYTRGMHDYRHKCSDWDRCFWLNWIYPARTDNLAPAETFTMSFADYLAGRDPVYDRALALAQPH